MENQNNPPAANVPSDLGAWRRLVGQHLKALSMVGAETLPRGNGQLEAFWLESDSTHEGDQSPRPNAALTRVNEVPPSPAGTTTISRRLEVHESPADADSGLASLSSVEPSQANAMPSEQSVPLKIESLSLPQRQQELEILQAEVAACTRCHELAASRTQTVFGVGNLAPRVVFVGEGPGAEEDKTGIPFVGAAGQLLDKILAASKLNREDVYILNTVKCRPPNNRNPSQEELDHCWGFAQRQLQILQPEFICCLGSVAAKRLLNTTQSLGRLRQRFHVYGNSRVIVTYHPAYLLRTESAKRFVWDDMKMLMKEMGVVL